MRLFCVPDALVVWSRGVRDAYQLAKGVCLLSRMHSPFITIFGGSRTRKEDPYSQAACEISKQLVKNQIAILTGGGPGVMEAAHRGASLIGKRRGVGLWSVGIGVEGVDERYGSAGDVFVSVGSFSTRKWLLTHYSSGFIIFPGGIGTMDELFELLNYIKHAKISNSPIILFGLSYWNPIIQWYNKAIKQGVIDRRFSTSLLVLDRIKDVVDVFSK